MALVKPIINEIVAFDAKIGTTITFNASGGDQIVKNEIKIISNEYVQGYFNSTDNLFYVNSEYTIPITGQLNILYTSLDTNNNYIYNGSIFVITDDTELIIYQNIVSTYNLTHVIPANTLTNGLYYKVAIRTYDILNNTSAWSNYQPFYCYTTPVISLNINEGQTINTSSYNIILTYNQIENEKIDYALIEIYNNNNILVSSSDNLYNSNFPPLTLNYNILGLDNHSQYYVKATVITIQGTIIQTNNIRFYTNYNTIIDKTTLTATLDSCNGYVNLHSSMLINITGESNPNPLNYINNEMACINNAVGDINNEEYASWAKWNKNLFTIPKNFLLRLWFYPASQPYEVIKISNENGDYISIRLQRSNTEDYISIRTNNGTIIDHPLGMYCNGNAKIFLWIKVNNNIWDVQTDVLSATTTILNWNDSNNNIQYNTTSDINYGGQPYGDFIPSANIYNSIDNELNTVIIGNGIFDHLNVTNDITISYNTDIPNWTDDTILNVNFNNNLIATPNYTRLVLKRKDSSILNWMNLSEIIFQPNIPMYIDFNDSFIPTGIKQEYALVVYLDDVPSEYHTVDITPIWSKYFLSDKNNRFVLNYAVIYSNHIQNIQNGAFMPIGATYPIVVQNGEGNYRSGSLQFKVLGYQYEENKQLDRISITKQLNDILAFLTNGNAKCLTDFNGNIFIIKVVNSPQISYDANWGNGIPIISFDWVEQGKYNNYNDMLELGLFDYIVTE